MIESGHDDQRTIRTMIVWGVQYIAEDNRGKPIAVGDLDMKITPAHCIEGSVVSGGGRFWLDELEVGEGIDIRGHMARCSAIIDFDTFGWVLARRDIGNAERGDSAEGVIDASFIILHDVCSHHLAGVASSLRVLGVPNR